VGFLMPFFLTTPKSPFFFQLPRSFSRGPLGLLTAAPLFFPSNFSLPDDSPLAEVPPLLPGAPPVPKKLHLSLALLTPWPGSRALVEDTPPPRSLALHSSSNSRTQPACDRTPSPEPSGPFFRISSFPPLFFSGNVSFPPLENSINRIVY